MTRGVCSVSLWFTIWGHYRVESLYTSGTSFTTFWVWDFGTLLIHGITPIQSCYSLLGFASSWALTDAASPVVMDQDDGIGGVLGLTGKDACKVVPLKNKHSQAFSVMVNVLLGFLSLSSLLIKRKWFDKKKRPNHVFTLDLSKLAVAGTVAHMLNILFAFSLDDTGTGDQCKFYLVNYLLDLLAGVPLSYFIILGNSMLAERQGWTSLERRGHYGRPIDYMVWAKQTVEFTFSLALAKVLLAIPLFAFKDEFDKIGAELVKPVQDHPHFELFFVMIVVPVTLNAVQFVIFDQILLDEHLSYDSIGPSRRRDSADEEKLYREGSLSSL